jgi:hypothetical protein
MAHNTANNVSTGESLIAALAYSIGGPVLTPGQPGYEAELAVFNLAGGFSLALGRPYGWAADSVVSLEVVTAMEFGLFPVARLYARAPCSSPARTPAPCSRPTGASP